MHKCRSTPNCRLDKTLQKNAPRLVRCVPVGFRRRSHISHMRHALRSHTQSGTHLRTKSQREKREQRRLRRPQWEYPAYRAGATECRTSSIAAQLCGHGQKYLSPNLIEFGCDRRCNRAALASALLQHAGKKTVCPFAPRETHARLRTTVFSEETQEDILAFHVEQMQAERSTSSWRLGR